jgi:hypothetical protein
MSKRPISVKASDFLNPGTNSEKREHSSKRRSTYICQRDLLVSKHRISSTRAQILKSNIHSEFHIRVVIRKLLLG